MIGILVEIIGLQQLNRIDPSCMPEILKKTLSFLELEPVNSLTSRNCIYFQFHYNEDEKRKLWEGVSETYDYLFENRDEFQGTMIFIDRVGNVSPDDGFNLLRRKSYAIRETDSLVITFRAEDYCTEYFDVERREEYLVLSSKRKWSPPGLVENNSFYYRERLVERIVDRLIPVIDDDESEPSIIHFYGSQGIGKTYNIKKSIRKIREQNPGLPLPVIIGTEGLKAAYQEIIESLDNDFIERIPEYLNVSEKESWEKRRFLLDQGASDHGPQDIFLFYRLYIQAYCTESASKLIPAYVICQDPEYLSADSLNLLNNIISEFLLPGGIVPIFITRTSSLPVPVSDFPGQRIRVTPLSLVEVEERLSQVDLDDYSTYEVREKTEGHVLYLSHYIMLRIKNITVPEEVTGRWISILLLKQLDLRLQKALYAVSLFPGLTDMEHWALILEENKIIHQDGISLLEELKDFGFLSEDQWLRPVITNTEEGVSLTAQDKEEIQISIAKTGSSIWRDQQVFSVYSFLQGLQSREAVVDFGRYFFDYTSQLLEQGQTERGEILLDVFQNLSSEDRKDTLSDMVIHTLGLRSALMQADQETARIRFLALSDLSENPLTLEEALNNLEAARYFYASCEYRQGLDAAKRALLFLQNGDNRLLKADANCQIGLIMLGMERMDEAAMYFALGREQLDFHQNPHNYIKTMVLEGLCQFLIGNLSQVRRLMTNARERAAAFGRREWELYSIFLLGRNDFELGRYEIAESTFIEGLLLCELYFDQKRKKIFYSWIARCQIYSNRYNNALNLLGSLKPDNEVLFFTSEALFFLGRYDRALDAINLAVDDNYSHGIIFSPGENISWKSGFSSVEDRSMRTREGTGVLYHMIRVFRGYLLGKGPEREVGRQDLARITRDERLGEEDPYNHFYYYLYNEIVPELGDTEIVNKLTILSRALKYLQQRASRIDETSDKKDYLYKNYWNSLLMKEGREQKIL